MYALLRCKQLAGDLVPYFGPEAQAVFPVAVRADLGRAAGKRGLVRGVALLAGRVDLLLRIHDLRRNDVLLIPAVFNGPAVTVRACHTRLRVFEGQFLDPEVAMAHQTGVVLRCRLPGFLRKLARVLPTPGEESPSQRDSCYTKDVSRFHVPKLPTVSKRTPTSAAARRPAAACPTLHSRLSPVPPCHAGRARVAPAPPSPCSALARP